MDTHGARVAPHDSSVSVTTSSVPLSMPLAIGLPRWAPPGSGRAIRHDMTQPTDTRGLQVVRFPIRIRLPASERGDQGYMPDWSMMWALGVPGNMIQGPPWTGSAESPVDAAVALGR
jgi:hypothetical protein